MHADEYYINTSGCRHNTENAHNQFPDRRVFLKEMMTFKYL